MIPGWEMQASTICRVLPDGNCTVVVDTSKEADVRSDVIDGNLALGNGHVFMIAQSQQYNARLYDANIANNVRISNKRNHIHHYN
jgi:hypothetical protein